MISMEPRITTLITGPQLFETVQFIVRYWKCSFCKVWLYIRPFVRPLWDFRVHWKRNSDFYRRLWEWKAFLGLEYIGSIGIKDDGSIVSIHFFKNMCRVNKRFFFRITHHAHGFVDVVCILQEEDLSGSTALMVAARNRGLATSLATERPRTNGRCIRGILGGCCMCKRQRCANMCQLRCGHDDFE